jgi:beta-lactamase regulating signal transducer with metallopeptidase domain
MRELFQSAFLQALGKAIADSIWQMGLLFLLYHLLVFLFRIKQATVKNFISTVFALGGFAWFISGIALRWQQQLLHKTSLVISEGNLNNTLLSNFTNDNRWELFFNWLDYKIQFVLPYLSIAYLFVLLWFGVKLVVQLQAANSLRYKGLSNVSDDMQEFFAYLVETLGLQRPVQLFISKQIDIPATLGFLKPIVLLPATAVTHLTAAQLEAVLLHELAHIKRNDYFWNLLLSVSETMLFFNPFALLLIGIARRERENSCDDHVMNFQQNAAVYAEALLNVEKARIQNPQLVMALGDNKHHLMDRVKRILNIPAEKNKISTRLLALLLFTVVFALMGWLIKERHPIAKTKQATTKEQPTKEKTNTVFFTTTDVVVKQKNDAVLLRDDKQKIRLELKDKINEEDILVWNENEGKEIKFDKVIFNDLPAEWIEQLVKPGVRVRLPDAKQRPGILLHHGPDSTFITEREKEMELYVENVDRLKQWRERFPQQKMRNSGGTTMMQYPKGANFDSLMQKLNGQFNFTFEGNHPYSPDVMFREYFTTEGFYNHSKGTPQHQAADDEKKERIKTKFTINRKPRKDTTDNAQLKSRLRTAAPVITYLYDGQGLREDMQLAQQHVQIILEDNHMRMMNQPPCGCPDSLQAEGQRTPQTPTQPKRVIRRLEVIKL